MNRLPHDHQQPKGDGHAVRAYNSHKVAGGGDKVAEISAGYKCRGLSPSLGTEWRDLASSITLRSDSDVFSFTHIIQKSQRLYSP